MKKVSKNKIEIINKTESLKQVLLKKAVGYKVKETTDEFSMVDEELKLLKRKVSVKYYPPDLNAIEIILKINDDLNDLNNLTDEELEEEKQKLLKKLKLIKDSQNGK